MPFSPPAVAYNPLNSIIPQKSFLSWTPTTATPGVAQVETATVAGACTAAGNALVTVTGAGIAGSPLALNVPVLNGDTAVMMADKIAAFLAGTAAITALYLVTNPAFGATVVLTALTPAANDATLNIAIATGTATGITAAPTSANTTLGAAPNAVTSLIGKVCKYDNKVTTVQREVPDADGYLRPDRIVAMKHEESFSFETEEVFLLAGLFGGLNGGFLQGTARIFVVDPADVTGTNVAVASNTFNATLELDGGLDFTDGKVVNAKLKINALQKVILTPHATS